MRYLLLCAVLILVAPFALAHDIYSAEAGSDVYIEGDDYKASAPGPAEAYAESNCNTSGASATGTGGGVSIGVSSYACDVQEMHDALARLKQGQYGFWGGKVPTFWLKAQLLTKGFYKTLWPF